MKVAFCSKCSCSLWYVSTYQEYQDLTHKLPDYGYCPNCKKVLFIKTESVEKEE